MKSRTAAREYTCHAQIELFTLEWSELPAEWRAAIREMRCLPCDGGGVPGNWCSSGSCVWDGGSEEVGEL